MTRVNARELAVHLIYSQGFTGDEPDVVVPGITDADWYIFGTDDYSDFFVAGIKNEKVQYLSSAGTAFEYMGYKSGDAWPGGPFPEHVTLSRDEHDGNKIHAVFIGRVKNRKVITQNELMGESLVVFHHTNAFRKLHNKKIFKPSAMLDTSSSLHSQDMAANNYFNHVSLDGRTMTKRMEAQGMRNWKRCAENIAAGQLTGYSAYAGWISSEGHRKNIMNDTTHLGVGMGYNPDSTYKYYYTQNFCSFHN